MRGVAPAANITGRQRASARACDGDADKPELLRITGFEVTMVGPDGHTPAPQQYMCHTNLDVDASDDMRRFDGARRVSGRLFTLSQGQYRIDFPKGHGIPIVSTQALDLNT
jgi:hypothetical protein